MFSKALFAQSCKANRWMWLIITVAVCFMLACVMLISGGGNIALVKNGIEDTMICSQIDSLTAARAINYYELTQSALSTFDTAFVQVYQTTGDPVAAYTQAVGTLETYAAQVAESKGYAEGSDEANEIKGVIFYALNPNGQFDDFYKSVGEEPLTYAMDTVGTPERAAYIASYSRQASAVFLAGNMTSEESVDKMVDQLSKYNISREKYDSFGYTYDSVKETAASTTVKYQAELTEKASALDPTAADYAEQLTALREGLTDSYTSSFLSSLPQEVSDALEEIGSTDLYNLIVGSIFYKMAGLLLPIIYVIMASNSLIAGQVDSGSMAYVLSTSTKRRQVTFTQAVFLISSLLAMTLCTTATSMVCLHIVKSDDITLTYQQLAEMNLGAFCTLFAIGGICFLTSAWFNRSKNSMAIGGGLSMFFLVATMLGLFGSPVLPSVIRLAALNNFNYFTLISLFDVISIIDGTTDFIWKFAILGGIGLVCYIAGSERFARKDLPL